MDKKHYSQSIRMDFTLAQKVKHIAKERDRSFNKQVSRILQDFVNQYEAEHGEIPINTE